MLDKDLLDFIWNIDNPERYKEQEENLAYLRNIEVSPLLKYYLFTCLKHLYFYIQFECKGNAYPLIMDEKLNTHCFDSTVTVIPFLQPNDIIQRGTIRPDSNQIIDHAWIKIKFGGNDYIFDPALGLIVPLSEYINVYKQNVKGEVSSYDVTSKIIETFKLNSPNSAGYYNLENGDINSEFYNNSLILKGTYKKHKIKKLAVYIPFNM